MMSRNLLLLLLSISFFSCTQSVRKNETSVTEDKVALYRKGLTAMDSLAVNALVDDFMKSVQEGKYSDAVADLYVLNEKDPYLKPELLDNDAIEETLSMMKKVKVQSYQIKSIEFISAVNNPTKCVIMAELPGNSTPVKLTWGLNPVNYLGKWMLCFSTK